MLNPDPIELNDTFIAFRARIFEQALALMSILATLTVFVSNGLYGVPKDVVMLFWFLVILGCASSFVLRRYFSLRIGIYAFVISALAINALAFVFLNPVLAAYLFAVVVALASVLVRRTTALAVCVFISALIFQIKPSWLPAGELLPPLLLVWLVYLVISLILDHMLSMLHLLSAYQVHVVQQMEAARESRAVLAQRTKALDEANQNLSFANNQLYHARRAAEEARRLKAQFAANVSHELRTPMNLIVGFAEMMIGAPKAYGVPLPSAYWSDMNTIFRNARHLQSLIDDVLDISQLEAGQMSVVKEEVSVDAVIREAADMLRDQIVNKGLRFDVLLADSLPVMWLDRVRIRQVVINLLGNALRFTDSGAIQLQADCGPAEVQVSVCDTGSGIPPDELDRVFQEFHQLDTSLARRFSGSGLGLTLSRHFVQMHGGRLWAESEGVPGRGSCFRLTLPLAGDVGKMVFSTETPGIPKHRERCILIMDEDPAILRLFERNVSKQKALGAKTVDEARQLLAAQPTVVIVDAKRDDAITQSFLADAEKTTPIVRCPMPSGRRTMQALGMADYLVKPVSYEALRDALMRITRPIKDVLVVDDDKEIVRLFTRMLQTMPETYAVKKAYSGAEGLDLMRAEPPDAVILDLLMPDVDGLTVVHQMKLSDALVDVPVIIVSARGAAEAVTVTGLGALSVRKPAGFQPLELVRCIEAIAEAVTPATAPAP
jgi:signal transduction histidine kinase/DNA-binding response OmpR family regulator